MECQRAGEGSIGSAEGCHHIPKGVWQRARTVLLVRQGIGEEGQKQREEQRVQLRGDTMPLVSLRPHVCLGHTMTSKCLTSIRSEHQGAAQHITQSPCPAKCANRFPTPSPPSKVNTKMLPSTLRDRSASVSSSGGTAALATCRRASSTNGTCRSEWGARWKGNMKKGTQDMLTVARAAPPHWPPAGAPRQQTAPAGSK